MPLSRGDMATCRLVFLGAARAGKSCLAARFLGRAVPDRYEATSDEMYRHQTGCACGKCTLLLEVVDTGGECDFPAMREQLIISAHVLLITFALDDEASLEEAREVYNEVKSVKSPVIGAGQCSRVVLVGNKSDAGRGADDQDTPCLLSIRAGQLASKWACPYIETSASTGSGVAKLVDLSLPVVCSSCRRRSVQKRDKRSGKMLKGQWRTKANAGRVAGRKLRSQSYNPRAT